MIYLLYIPEGYYIKNIIKIRNDLLERVWNKGQTEWSKLVNYLASQYIAEDMGKRFQISKGCFVGTIGGFAVGHLLGYIGTKGDIVNWKIAEYLLIIWIVAIFWREIKNTVSPSRRQNIELTLKGVKKFSKNKKHFSNKTAESNCI